MSPVSLIMTPVVHEMPFLFSQCKQAFENKLNVLLISISLSFCIFLYEPQQQSQGHLCFGKLTLSRDVYLLELAFLLMSAL